MIAAVVLPINCGDKDARPAMAAVIWHPNILKVANGRGCGEKNRFRERSRNRLELIRRRFGLDGKVQGAGADLPLPVFFNQGQGGVKVMLLKQAKDIADSPIQGIDAS